MKNIKRKLEMYLKSKSKSDKVLEEIESYLLLCMEELGSTKFGRIVGDTKETVNKYKNGHQKMSLNKIKQYVGALDV